MKEYFHVTIADAALALISEITYVRSEAQTTMTINGGINTIDHFCAIFDGKDTVDIIDYRTGKVIGQYKVDDWFCADCKEDYGILDAIKHNNKDYLNECFGENEAQYKVIAAYYMT